MEAQKQVVSDYMKLLYVLRGISLHIRLQDFIYNALLRAKLLTCFHRTRIIY